MRVKTNALCACKHVPCHAHGIHNYMYVWCYITLPLVDSFIQTVRDAVTTGFPRTNAPPTLAAFVKTATRGEALTHTYIVSIRFLDHAKKTPQKYGTLTASIGSLIMSLHMP